MKAVVKKWFRDKDSGFLENGNGQDIIVRRVDLLNCQFLKIGVTVEFECHVENHNLIAKKVKFLGQKHSTNSKNRDSGVKKFPYGVMT